MRFALSQLPLGVCALFALAAAAVGSHPARAAGADLDVAVRLAAEIGKSVNVLTRDVTTYHWQPRRIVGLPETGEIDPRDANALEYYRVNAASFWFNRPSRSMMGNGIYVATDPAASMSFGSELWALLVVRLKAGSHLLEARESATFSSELRARLQGIGCPAWTSPTEIYSSLSYSTIPADACAPTFYEAIRLLGVQGTVYGYGGFSLAACSLRNGWSMPAIVLNDPHLASDVHVLVREIPAAEPREVQMLRLRVAHFFSLLQGTPRYPFDAPWPSLVATAPPADLIEWIQSETYFCDAVHWEDLLPSQIVFPAAELVEKQEEVLEKAAILSAKLGRPIRPGQFRGIIGQQYYTAAQLQGPGADERLAAPEFQAWLHAHASITQSAERREPLAPGAILNWARQWTLAGQEKPEFVSDRLPALAELLNELNSALFNPRQASARDRALLRDPHALIRAYHDRFAQLAPLSRLNDRMARAIVDYVATVRGWPPILIRGSLDEVTALGALQAVIVMDKCLDRYASGKAALSVECSVLE